MISEEEIKMARERCAQLTVDDFALLLVNINPKGELRILMAGEDKSTDSLLQKLSSWCEQLRSERRKK